ncbi:YdeI/OmpD-associated family protein [Roseiconus lacunae]|uniref:YdeI/OmpD-associated family protein n=1 Tax=Roseiconus lacunae TaxID=2605694 RepID=UPI001E2CBC7E|nr:YdeI/OmpD-associated family protein [Roseiconus lacunae]MCD0462907.1 YdeI/OmpD-associated family protein [Roseiconus lacunae]
MAKYDPQVTDYIRQDTCWPRELRTLRSLLIGGGLKEAYKWRAPCYTYGDANVAMLASLKQTCTLSFFKGVLLTDPEQMLVAPGKNSQSARVLRFRSVSEIEALESSVQRFIREAIEIEKSGVSVEFRQKDELEIPDELLQMYDQNPRLKAAFDALTPGRRRGYVLHFNGAKQSKTRLSRIEKSIPRIFEGKGIHDCICGLSKRMPRCDGSHSSDH